VVGFEVAFDQFFVAASALVDDLESEGGVLYALDSMGRVAVIARRKPLCGLGDFGTVNALT
jgi:hypothetical protein